MQIKGHPYIVATGTTSAFLGDERLLREFVIGDQAQRERIAHGQNAILYLINDSYDGLREGQCRLAVNKDEGLLEKYREFLGRPIAEIPDPFDCHASFAEHFIAALLKRLRSLDIHPVVMDSYRGYKSGAYQAYVELVFNRYQEIQAHLAACYPQFRLHNLFRVQCHSCQRIDETDITEVTEDTVAFRCKACGLEGPQPRAEIKGKLSWKLDCAARWNIYGIHAEAFSKSHCSELGSYDISGFISKEYFEGNVPVALRYGELKLDNELSYRLLDILPPTMFKQLLLENPERDLELTKASIEHFCRRTEVVPGMSYVDFVKRELPLLAISDRLPGEAAFLHNSRFDTQELLYYGNRFSGYYFHQEYDISLAGADAITTVSRDVAQAAQSILHYTLEVRRNEDWSEEQKQSHLAEYLKIRQSIPGVFPYLRKIFGQQQGPGIASLLISLPLDYLNVIRMAVGFYVSQKAGEV